MKYTIESKTITSIIKANNEMEADKKGNDLIGNLKPHEETYCYEFDADEVEA